MSGPPRGHVRLYSAIRPALFAGTYKLQLRQQLNLGGGEARTLPGHVQDLELVAPRFRMSGTELYSLFPPPNAQGPFTNRFAQAVLKRRTLPWERPLQPGSADRRTPWMALVVLADGEGTFRTDVPLDAEELADYRAGIGLSTSAARDAGSCDVLEVSERVASRVLPTVADLPYLTHVREVNLRDSEDANLLDDDGFVAVVASSRVLRGGQAYGAYLVSLEGQRATLPERAAATNEIGPPRVPPRRVRPVAGEVVWSGGHLSVDAATPFRVETGPRPGTTATLPAGTPGRLRRRMDGWEPAGEPGPAATEHGRLLATGFEAMLDILEVQPVDVEPAGAALRYPVLAHWSFQTIKDGDFESLMRNLDVGLLGTVDEEAQDPPTVLATGHLLLDRHARHGERTAGWYRSPLVPHELEDRDDVPLHAAEQALRIGRDGIEDLSYAAAFELGRLLALAEPRFVSALITWRRRGSTRSWGRLKRRDFLLDLLPPFELDRLERYISLGVIERLLGRDGLPDPLGPLVNPVPLREVYELAADAVALERIGIDRGLVEDALGLAATPSGFGGETLDPGGLIDTGGFRDVVAGIEGALGADLAANLDAAWRRDVGRISDLGRIQ